MLTYLRYVCLTRLGTCIGVTLDLGSTLPLLLHIHEVYDFFNREIL